MPLHSRAMCTRETFWSQYKDPLGLHYPDGFHLKGEVMRVYGLDELRRSL
jgi:hypothetical protein